MSAIAIVGSGAMGSALMTLFAGGDDPVRQVGRSSVDPITEDIVILAVPYDSLDKLARQYGEELDGRIVVDLSNPVDLDSSCVLKVAPASSAAAELQAALPRARVVKAFNTNFAETLGTARVGDHGPKTTVLVAGDDVEAKKTIIALTRASGLAALDAGSLARARELEAIGLMQMSLANDDQIGWSAGFALIA